MLTIDNYRLWEEHDRREARRDRKLPTCERCAEPIRQWDAVRIGRRWYCDECLKEMREETMEDSW